MKNLHLKLRQYRVIPIAVTVYLMWFTAYITDAMLINILQLTQWQLAPFVTIIPALIAGLFKTSQIALEKQEDDNESY